MMPALTVGSQATARMVKLGPDRYVSGAKILYRGRMMRLVVKPTTADEVQVEYRNGFHVARPDGCGDHEVRAALEGWMQDRLRADVDTFVRRHTLALGVSPAAIRIRDPKHLWGSCGKNGVIHVSWKLIRAPKRVLDYAVVHELCHLRHRSHSQAFWVLLGQELPGFETFRAWLAQHQRSSES